jgi:flagella basal body P-ring formation protein FlgA
MLLLFSLLAFLQGTSDINKIIEQFLAEKLKNYSGYEFEIVKIPDGFARITAAENLIPGINYLPAEVKDKNNKKINSYLIIKLKLYKNLLVLNRDLNEHTIIDDTMFVEKQIDLSEIKGTPFLKKVDLSEFRTKKKLKSGQPLLEEQVEKNPVIKTGDRITAALISGTIRISIDAVARQDGAAGQFIRIKSGDNKIFNARVIDPGNVIIIE